MMDDLPYQANHCVYASHTHGEAREHAVGFVALESNLV